MYLPEMSNQVSEVHDHKHSKRLKGETCQDHQPPPSIMRQLAEMSGSVKIIGICISSVNANAGFYTTHGEGIYGIYCKKNT